MASWGVEQRSGARAGALAWHSTHDSRVNELFTDMTPVGDLGPPSELPGVHAGSSGTLT